ncbi:hypothetical protein PFMALIP_04979 [Plasmodium falciparum MaliPS096_E11]|uniref:Uncharacterized protein n=1 Tax=Plasmodium falciparum MaliPS096_E11 TaxID=1036727 RepID=A0A024WJY5_PLAFA|nr:hypothetical protein PFMALIP_04979 [Plasmodium falciparum MaliPS096_E11]
MNINFYVYDDEADNEIISSNFNVYCSDEFLKIHNMEKNDNAIIYHEIMRQDEEEGQEKGQEIGQEKDQEKDQKKDQEKDQKKDQNKDQKKEQARNINHINNIHININKIDDEYVEKEPKPNVQNFSVLCCFKNYNELNIKKKLENNGLCINKYILKSLNLDIKEIEEKNIYKSCKDQNNNMKKIGIFKVSIIKPQLFIPIKEIKLHVQEIFNTSYEYLKSYQYENIDLLQSFWKNIKSNNMEKYINLSLLNTCLFVNNFLKITILGVHSYITVGQIILTKDKKTKMKNNNNNNKNKTVRNMNAHDKQENNKNGDNKNKNGDNYL